MKIVSVLTKSVKKRAAVKAYSQVKKKKSKVPTIKLSKFVSWEAMNYAFNKLWGLDKQLDTLMKQIRDGGNVIALKTSSEGFSAQILNDDDKVYPVHVRIKDDNITLNMF